MGSQRSTGSNVARVIIKIDERGPQGLRQFAPNLIATIGPNHQV
jgi:hypothetical protein